MITVHHLEHSRSERVLWLLEELGIEYTVKRYPRDPKTSLAPPELRAIHPLGKAPIITDGDVTVAESGAILEYLTGTYGKGAFVPPAATEAYRQYIYWLHFAEGSLMPYLVMKLVFTRIDHAPMPFFVKPIARQITSKVRSGFLDPNLENTLNFIEAHLARNAWFAGEEFSAADIQMAFPLTGAMTRATKSGQYPSIVAFLERVKARPAYQRAETKGGAFGPMDRKP